MCIRDSTSTAAGQRAADIAAAIRRDPRAAGDVHRSFVTRPRQEGYSDPQQEEGG